MILVLGPVLLRRPGAATMQVSDPCVPVFFRTRVDDHLSALLGVDAKSAFMSEARCFRKAHRAMMDARLEKLVLFSVQIVEYQQSLDRHSAFPE